VASVLLDLVIYVRQSLDLEAEIVGKPKRYVLESLDGRVWLGPVVR
jgi:hypothetical protein